MRLNWNQPPIVDQANAAITGGSITGVTGVRQVLARWSIPFISVSTGSMANNGVLSGITALPNAYAGGAWMYLPANAIQAGSAAGWYWYVGATTTTGTVFNSTYTSGIPAAGTATAFSTTGPGAFTGDIAEEMGPTISIAGNVIGANGQLSAAIFATATNSAGAKTARIRYSGSGGTVIYSGNVATSQWASAEILVWSQGVTNKQLTGTMGQASVTNAAVPQAYLSVDQTGSTSFVYSMQKAVATDNGIIEGGAIYLNQ